MGEVAEVAHDVQPRPQVGRNRPSPGGIAELLSHVGQWRGSRQLTEQCGDLGGIHGEVLLRHHDYAGLREPLSHGEHPQGATGDDRPRAGGQRLQQGDEEGRRR